MTQGFIHVTRVRTAVFVVLFCFVFALVWFGFFLGWDVKSSQTVFDVTGHDVSRLCYKGIWRDV